MSVCEYCAAGDWLPLTFLNVLIQITCLHVQWAFEEPPWAILGITLIENPPSFFLFLFLCCFARGTGFGGGEQNIYLGSVWTAKPTPTSQCLYLDCLLSQTGEVGLFVPYLQFSLWFLPDVKHFRKWLWCGRPTRCQQLQTITYANKGKTSHSTFNIIMLHMIPWCTNASAVNYEELH